MRNSLPLGLGAVNCSSKGGILLNRFIKLAWHFFLLIIIYEGLRLLFLINNIDFFQDFATKDLLKTFISGLRFDLAGIGFINFLYVILYMFPIKDEWMNKSYLAFLKWLFVISNGIFITANISDAEYFKFSGTRLSLSSFKITQDLADQSLQLIGYYWYLSLLIIFNIGFLAYFYDKPFLKKWNFKFNFFSQNFLFLLMIFFMVVFARGGLQLKPVIPANAFANNKPRLAQLALNSSFTILKSSTQEQLSSPHYFKNWNEILNILNKESSVNKGIDPLPENTNVVIFILESFALEYMGLPNSYEGYTPFLDEIANNGHFFYNHFANGRRSIDALPSILGGLPALMDTAFIVSRYQTCSLNGLPATLDERGYSTAFFHGGKEGTMYFDVLTKMLGFHQYFGASDYPNEKDHSGSWGIHDHSFFSFSIERINEMKKPCFCTIFSLSSHHPYNIPPEHENHFPKGTLEIHESIGYADYALRQFFEKAKTQDWFDNTLFIFTADHTSKSEYPQYQTNIGRFRIPLIFYHPQKSLPLVSEKTVAQHVDITPTILDLLGILQTKKALFGNSLIKKDNNHYALIYNSNTYWLVKDDFLTQMNPDGSIEYFNREQDPLQTKQLSIHARQKNPLDNLLKANIQYYKDGLKENKISW